MPIRLSDDNDIYPIPLVTVKIPLLSLYQDYIKKNRYEKISASQYRIRVKYPILVNGMYFTNIRVTKYLKRFVVIFNEPMTIEEFKLLYNEKISVDILNAINYEQDISIGSSSAQELFKKVSNIPDEVFEQVKIVDLETIEIVVNENMLKTLASIGSIFEKMEEKLSKDMSVSIKLEYDVKDPSFKQRFTVPYYGTLIHHYFLLKTPDIVSFAVRSKILFDELKKKYTNIWLLDVENDMNKTIGNCIYIGKDFDINKNVIAVLIISAIHH
jgi:hypothetical protein